MQNGTQEAKAIQFRNLHVGPCILVLPNAWDPASARIFENVGFRAVGTTSAGIAASWGYPDGQYISRNEMLEAIARIARAVALPVSADMEAGYGETVEEVYETAKGVVAAGAVGLNLEDGTRRANRPLVDVSQQIEKIKAVREVACSTRVPLVVNARTDVYLRSVGEPATWLENAVRRANAYREAGADCLFVPGVSDADTIATLVREIDGPLNILADRRVPSILELEKFGVARVSLGSGPMRATLALIQRIGRELLERGTYASFAEDAMSYAEMNRLFES